MPFWDDMHHLALGLLGLSALFGVTGGVVLAVASFMRLSGGA